MFFLPRFRRQIQDKGNFSKQRAGRLKDERNQSAQAQIQIGKNGDECSSDREERVWGPVSPTRGGWIAKNFPKGAVIVWELYPPNFKNNKQENGTKFPEFYRAKIKAEENFPGFRNSKQGGKRKCFGF